MACARNLSIQLIKRNYEPKTIFRISNLVGNMDRNTLIPYRSKNQSIDLNKNLLFITPFDNTIPDLNNKVVSSFKDILPDSLVSLKPINSIQNNLISILVHGCKTDLLFRNKKFSQPCNLLNCKTCSYINEKF